MIKINYYGGLCPNCKSKLDFKTDKTEDNIHLLFCSCKKCDEVFMLDLNTKKEFSLDNVEIDYKIKLKIE